MTSPPDLTDAALARAVADTAGAMLLTLQRSGRLTDQALGDTADFIANVFIVAALRAARPNDAILSEEEAPDLNRLDHRRVWIVDPLDGTREYAEGRSDWAVHVALAVDGYPADGAVALPGVDATLCSAHPLGLVPPFDMPVKMLVSRTRPPAEAVAIAAALGAELVPMGSAGAKAMAVIRNEADIYIHSGGQYEWDSCAPAAVALAAGLHVSRLDGTPLVYNQPDPLLPDILICHPQHAAWVLQTLAKLRRDAGAP